jgi:hypothetical protein
MSTFLVKIVNSIPAISHLSMGTWVVVGLAAAPIRRLIWSFLAKKTGLNRALLLSYCFKSRRCFCLFWAPVAGGLIISAVLFGGYFYGYCYAEYFDRE